jgi:hypothetical protein
MASAHSLARPAGSSRQDVPLSDIAQAVSLELLVDETVTTEPDDFDAVFSDVLLAGAAAQWLAVTLQQTPIEKLV